MEHDFCAMASAQGAPAAFAHFAAPDAAFFDVDPRAHRGPEAVRLRPHQPTRNRNPDPVSRPTFVGRGIARCSGGL